MPSIVFIDARVALTADLLKDLSENARVVTLDPSRDGVQQMATALDEVSDLSAIHIITHGSAGTLYLGGSTVTSDNLDQYRTQLAAVSKSLSDMGDILIYGCDVARGETGLTFVQQFANLTSADVAASDDPTGSSLLGGDAELEVRIGDVTTSSVLDQRTLNSLDLLLAKPATTQSLIPQFDAAGVQDWEPVTGSRETVHNISYVVIHTTWLSPIDGATSGGTAQSNINYWKGSSGSQSSAHYIIDSGTIYQAVEDNNIAYHAGQFSYNQKSIGIEICATASVSGTISNAELSALADLVRWLCQTYNIPMVHPTGSDNSSDGAMLAAGIIGHSQISLNGKTDPGPYFDWTNFINLVDGGATNTAPTVTILANSSYPAGTVLTASQLFSVSDAQGQSNIDYIKIYDANVTNGAVWKYNGSTITPGGGGYQVAYANRDLLTYTVGTGSNDFQVEAFDKAGAVSNDPIGSITGTAINRAPVANADSYSTNMNAALTISAPGVLSNDTDPDNNAVSVTSYTLPSHGTITSLTSNGAFTYVPASGYTGPDSFTYTASDGALNSTKAATVSITVNSVNTAPTVTILANSSYSAGTVLTASQLFSVNDAQGQSNIDFIKIYDSNVTGGAVWKYNGSTITPGGGGYQVAYANRDLLTYTVGAGSNDFQVEAFDKAGAVSNDPIGSITGIATDRAPVANADSYTTHEDTALTVWSSGVLANDTDADGNSLTAVVTSNPSHGTLSLSTDGTFSYTPAADYTGSDSFSYQANDGTSNSDVAATVSITVNPMNDPPVANADSYSTNEDTTLTVPATGVLGNDTDVDGNDLKAILTSTPSHGILLLNADGSFSYTPTANYTGSDSFSYRANDGTDNSDTGATVLITVNPMNDAPGITSNGGGATTSVSVAENTTVVTTVTATDADGVTPTYSLSGGADQGRFTINAVSGALSFVAAPNFEAPNDSDANNTYVVIVRATDGTLTDDQTITVGVTDSNDLAPVITTPATHSLAENVTVVAALTATDADTVGANPATFTITGGADSAIFNIVNGNLVFKAPPDFESPADSDHNNSYLVQIAAFDGVNTSSKLLTVNISTAVDTLSSSVTATLPAGMGNLTLTGNGAINGSGNNLANVITGNVGNNVLDGGGGADSIFGGNGNDTLEGGVGPDSLVGGAGDDRYVVDNPLDTVDESTGSGIDTVFTGLATFALGGTLENLRFTGAQNSRGTGNDLANTVEGHTGNDTLLGGRSNDALMGNAGNDSLDGGSGVDRLTGGAGDDSYLVGNGDIVEEVEGGGIDTVFATFNISLARHVENVKLMAGTTAANANGNDANNVMAGNDLANALAGGNGTDSLSGGAGNDTLNGGKQRDTLSGGSGSDTFLFGSLAESTLSAPDVIKDLSAGDRLDLSRIDANTLVTGDQAFQLVQAFTGQAGQLALKFNASANRTTVTVDVNGDAAADMAIQILGQHTSVNGWLL